MHKLDIAMTGSTLFLVAEELRLKPDVLRQDVASSEHIAVEAHGTICSNLQEL
jgi:hypothetical protein